MNGLVDAVNQKIQDAINNFGSQAIYVPWTADVDFITGHYCEPGVDEWNAINREQTAFYEWGSNLDDLPELSDNDELRKRQALGFLTARQTVNTTGQAPGVLTAGQNLNNTWEGQIAAWVLDAINQGATPEDFNLTSPDVVQAQGGLLLPGAYICNNFSRIGTKSGVPRHFRTHRDSRSSLYLHYHSWSFFKEAMLTSVQQTYTDVSSTPRNSDI